MNILENIETKFGFTYPALYKQLYQENFLNWGFPSSNWYKEVYPTLKDNPPFLLYSDDFELLDFDEIIEEIENTTDPEDYRRVNPLYKFIPFAKNGKGDSYCFLYTEEFKDDIPVVYMWHDDNEADILAKNLEDFIFRKLLEAVTDIWHESLIMHGSFTDNIANMLKTHWKLLSASRQTILEEIYNRELLQGEQIEEAGLLTDDELEQLLQSEIGFDKLDEGFIYSLPEPVLEITEENKRRVGTLWIRINPMPPKNDKIYDILKTLNWRQNKNETALLEFHRKQSIVFGLPSINTIGDTFRDKLNELRTASANVELLYVDNETGIVYTL